MEGRKDKRQRRSIQAQMDMGKPHERSIFEYHEQSKKRGSWKSDFVKAITLYRDLLTGQVDVLRDLFPRIVDAVRLFLAIERGDLSIMRELFPERYKVFKLELEADILESINQDSHKDVLRELRLIKAELENLKASGVQSPASAGSGGIKQIGTLAIPAPNFDDEDEDLFSVRKDELAGERVANNFIASITQTQSIKPDPSLKIGRQK